MAKKYPAQLKQFGKRIKFFREEDKMTQESLAKRSGIGVRTIQRIESGTYAINLRTTFALCEALRANIEDVFLHVDQPWLKKPGH